MKVLDFADLSKSDWKLDQISGWLEISPNNEIEKELKYNKLTKIKILNFSQSVGFKLASPQAARLSIFL